MSDGSSWPLAQLRDVTIDVPNVDPSRHPDDSFTYVDISAIDNERCVITTPKRLLGKQAPSRARRPIRDGDVLFSNVRTYLRNVAQVHGIEEPAIASTGFTVLRPNGKVASRFLYHLARSDYFIDQVTPEQTGTHYPATSDRVVRNQRIPLPPLAVQEQVSLLIDEVESVRQSARGYLGSASIAIEHFRQAVLAAACSGRLTVDWREANASATSPEHFIATINAKRRERLGRRYREPVRPKSGEDLPDGWYWTTIGALVDVATGATPLRKRADYYNGSIPWVTSGAVNAGLINGSTDYITELALKETNAKVFPAGTLLVAMYGEGQTRGRVAELGIDSATNQALAALLFEDYSECLRPYLHLFLLENYERIRQLSFGGVQPNLSLGAIRDTALPLPPLEEQAEIVRRVDQLLEHADAVTKSIERASSRVDQTAQAILGKAFRGELTNDED